jgi:hypothetical protein
MGTVTKRLKTGHMVQMGNGGSLLFCKTFSFRLQPLALNILIFLSQCKDIGLTLLHMTDFGYVTLEMKLIVA